jgi:hypothetical protein
MMFQGSEVKSGRWWVCELLSTGSSSRVVHGEAQPAEHNSLKQWWRALVAYKMEDDRRGCPGMGRKKSARYFMLLLWSSTMMAELKDCASPE